MELRHRASVQEFSASLAHSREHATSANRPNSAIPRRIAVAIRATWGRLLFIEIRCFAPYQTSSMDSRNALTVAAQAASFSMPRSFELKGSARTGPS